MKPDQQPSPSTVLSVLTDSVHFDQSRSPFTENFSQFSICFIADSPIGPGPLYPRAMEGTRFVLDIALQWCLRKGDVIEGIHRQHLVSLPWVAEEESTILRDGTTLVCRARHVFVDERHLRSEFTVTNTGTTPAIIDPVWHGVVAVDRRYNPAQYANRDFHAEKRESFLRRVGPGIEAGLRVTREPRQMPQAAARITPLSKDIKPWTGREPFYANPRRKTCPGTLSDLQKSPCYAFVGKPAKLAPGQSFTYAFHIAYSPAWHKQPDFQWNTAINTEPVDTLVARAQSRVAANLGLQDKAPEPVNLNQQLLRARYTLLRCGVRGMDGHYGDRLACLCTPGITGLATLFFWDTIFSSVALGAFHPQYAKDTIRVILSNPSPSGALEHTKSNYPTPARCKVPQPQGPIASWAVDQYLKLHGDDLAFLREIYPALKANHEFWTRQDVDGDGLSEWSHCGLIADDSPIFDPYRRKAGDGNFFLPPIASVSLNSFLYKDAMLLAAFAKRLGKSDEARGFRRGADQRFQKMMEICFLEEDGCFYDFDHHRRAHRRVNTFQKFWPVMWDLPLPDKMRHNLIEKSLLDPSQYFGAVPFPSVAYNDPNYEAGGYWRGRAWPHISYWLIASLWRYGYTRQAESAAARLLSWQSLYSGQRENMCTDPTLAESFEANDFSWRTGRDFDYNWSAATIALLLEQRYRL